MPTSRTALARSIFRKAGARLIPALLCLAPLACGPSASNSSPPSPPSANAGASPEGAPHALDPLLAQAAAAQHIGNYQAAMDAYRTILAHSPHDPNALVGLANLYIDFGWLVDAEKLLVPEVQAAPDALELRETLALTYQQHNDYVAAEQQLLEIKKRAPQQVGLWSPLIDLYNKTGRYQEAIPLAREALATVPGEVTLIDELARSYYHLNDLPAAINALQQALGVREDDLIAHYYLGLCYQQSGQTQKAISEFETIEEHAPNYHTTPLLLGQLYVQQGKTAEGKRLIANYRQVEAQAQRHKRAGMQVVHQPDNPEAHWQMAQVYLAEGAQGKAIVELKRTLQLAPNHAGAQRLLASLKNANPASQ